MSEQSRSLLVGSFRRAFAETDSLLLRSYAVVGALLAALLVVVLLLALPVWIFASEGGSELITFSRTFLLVAGVLLFVALAAPVLSSARRHRRGTASSRADFLLALAGYLFVASLYLALVISAPPDMRDPATGALAPVISFLYALPPIYALAPPALALAFLAAVHRFAR